MECETGIHKALDLQMVHAMTKVPAHWLSVPIETSGDYGTNWGKMEEIQQHKKVA